MALKVELKPNERIIIGNAVIRNGEQRTRFFIEGEAPILREKDILTPRTADTPAKRIYLAVQLMYLTGDSFAQRGLLPSGARFPGGRARAPMPLIAEVNNRILSGDLYKALRSAKKLVAYEQELMDHALRGERVLEGRTDHAVAAGA